MNAISSPQPAPRIRELDGLRGLAALSVVFFHFTLRFGQLFGAPEGLWFDFPRGDYGVQLFFMISGFVIFMTLDRTRTTTDFVVARFARLYPAYWAAMLLTFTVVSLFGLPGQEVGLRDFVVNLTMVQSLLHVPHVDGAYWSLQAEILFYAAMLSLWRFGFLSNAICTLSIWLTVAVAVQCAAWWLPEQLAGALGPVLTLGSLRFIHLFIIGMALYQQRGVVAIDPGWLLLVVACWFWHALVDAPAGAALVAAFTVVMYLATAGQVPWLASRPLAYLGGISYTLYLVHQNVGYVIIRTLNGWGLNANVSLLIAVGCVMGLAIALSRYVERPALAAIKSRYAAWQATPRRPLRLPKRRRHGSAGC